MTKNRKKKYFGKIEGGGSKLLIGMDDPVDYLSALGAYLSAEFPKETKRAVHSTAYFAQQEMKRAFPLFGRRLGRPTEIQSKRLFDKAEGGSKGLKNKPYYGADSSAGKGLGRAFNYRKYEDNAVIGWLTSSARKSADRWQTGGIKTVTGSEAAIYRKAALAAGKRWPYKHRGKAPYSHGPSREEDFDVISVGKGKGAVKLMVPTAGARIEHKAGGQPAMFIDHFFKSYRGVITSTLRRKIEEKLDLSFRGGHDKQIRLDMEAVRKGAQIATYRYRVNIMRAIQMKQLNSALRRIV